jgi:hypothetical protein
MENNIDDKTAKKYLLALFEWSKKKAQEVQPPWAFYRYMQLSDVTETIITSMEQVKLYNCPPIKRDNSLQLDKHQEKHLQLVVNNEPSQDNVLLRRDTIRVNMPM